MIWDKEALIQSCIGKTHERLLEIQSAMEMANDSIVNDTKSSMGDKYETSREMAQQQLSRLQVQKLQAQSDLSILNNLAANTKNKVSVGSIIITNQYHYLIATSIGPMIHQGQKIMVISKESPIGNLLIGKIKGDKLSFNGQHFQIIDIQ